MAKRHPKPAPETEKSTRTNGQLERHALEGLFKKFDHLALTKCRLLTLAAAKLTSLSDDEVRQLDASTPRTRFTPGRPRTVT